MSYRPKQLSSGSRRWWTVTMRRWSNQIARGVPKNYRRRPKGTWEKRPAWSGATPPYGLTYEQRCEVAAANWRMNGGEEWK